MAGVIATLLTNSTFISSAVEKGPGRHVYNEIVALQAKGDPVLAAPYVLASHVATLPAHYDTISSGNFLITINLPRYNVSVTTGNVAFDAEEAAIQTAIDSAMSGEVCVGGLTYNAGDIAVALTGNLTANGGTLTFEGTCNGAWAEVTTANAGDLDADKLSTPSYTALGTLNRPCEAFLFHYGFIAPTTAGLAIPHGATLLATNYELLNEGNLNANSVSPALLDAVLLDLAVEQQEYYGGYLTDLSSLFRSLIACV